MRTTLAKTQSFAQFRHGWSFGEGVAFAQSTLDKANQLVTTAHTLGFHETDTFPGLNGEVMVTVYQGAEYWGFTIQPTETILFIYEKDDETATYTAEQQTTASGDVCHYNLLGVSDKAARSLS